MTALVYGELICLVALVLAVLAAIAQYTPAGAWLDRLGHLLFD